MRVAMATGVQPVFPEAPPDTRAEQLPDPHIGKDGFLDLFGRPPRESSLRVRAAQRLQPAAGAEPGEREDHFRCGRRCRTAAIAKSMLAGAADRDLVEELYLASLSRPPTAAEMEKGLEVLAGASRSRAARAQDLLWALLNSKAFLYNYARVTAQMKERSHA